MARRLTARRGLVDDLGLVEDLCCLLAAVFNSCCLGLSHIILLPCLMRMTAVIAEV